MSISLLTCRSADPALAVIDKNQPLATIAQALDDAGFPVYCIDTQVKTQQICRFEVVGCAKNYGLEHSRVGQNMKHGQTSLFVLQTVLTEHGHGSSHRQMISRRAHSAA